MNEIYRGLPQSTSVLALFLLIALIYVFLYNDEPRRLRYFFSSAFNKQYQVNYGRQGKILQHFSGLISLQSLLMASFFISEYLSYCTRFSGFSLLFGLAFLFLSLFLVLKWLLIYGLAYLFGKQRLFNEFLTLSIQYANLYFVPFILIGVYTYLSGDLSRNLLTILMSIALLSLALSKIKVLVQLRKDWSLHFYYIILYLCAIELAPFLWLQIGVDC